ncbi:MAG: caspase family protein [Clostridia bacterium]|nr:caspase family protein [Clostridia bacterium]
MLKRTAILLTAFLLLTASALADDLLDTVLTDIEVFDPLTDEELPLPEDEEELFKTALNLYGLKDYGLTTATVGKDERTTRLPTAALVLGLCDLLKVTPESQNLDLYGKYAELSDGKYWLVQAVNYTSGKVYQLKWTPGEAQGEGGQYRYTVQEFFDQFHSTIYTRMNNDALAAYYAGLRHGRTGALSVGKASFRLSSDRQSIYIDRPAVSGGTGQVTYAYNIYDDHSNPVNYFYSNEKIVAATPGYGGLFNVFITVRDILTAETATQNIGWQSVAWPYASTLTVGKVSFERSANRKSVYMTRPSIKCKSGSVTIAYNIYDANSRPVNYFYSTEKRVAATPGYDGRFNVFIVVTDTVTKETNTQNIGWIDLGKVYRALLICNYDFPGTTNDLGGNPNSTAQMEDALKTINGGLYLPHLTKKLNVHPDKAESTISSAFKGAVSGDVSLFYISSHGSSDGCASFSDGKTSRKVSWADLAKWLNEANPNNKVIVIIDTCYANIPIAHPDSGAEKTDPNALYRSVTAAFAAVDRGITVPTVTTDEYGHEKRGELRTSKFEVLAAGLSTETTWTSDSKGAYFTRALVTGLTGSGRYLPADTDHNSYVTTSELSKHIVKTFDAWAEEHPNLVSQHPFTWGNADYQLFWR